LLVVVAILVVITGILLAASASARSEGHRATVLNNLRQIGMAKAIYDPDDQRTWDSLPDPLVKAQLVPPEILTHALDPTKTGWGNGARLHPWPGGEKLPELPPKLSYLTRWELGLAFAGPIASEKNRGWLIAPLDLGDREARIPAPFTGRYLRLRMDGSVIQRTFKVETKIENGSEIRSQPGDFFEDME
jgi:hypothetical protein